MFEARFVYLEIVLVLRGGNISTIMSWNLTAGGVTSKWFCYESTLLTLAISATAFSFYRDRTMHKARKMFYASLLYLPVFMSGILLHRLSDDQHCTVDNEFDSKVELESSLLDAREKKKKLIQAQPPIAYASVAPFPFLPVPSYAP